MNCCAKASFNKQATGEARWDLSKVTFQRLKAGAIDASISTETVLEFLQAIAGMQTQWGMASEYQTKIGEVHKLMLYGLIGR
ncbi:hypothetical protein B1A99_26905 [Cohnella sp. CIP 111063]|uniref:hypothetical protein n=1 Tax=unclassified Cohnella TaxID=2636738 RepID=UPI000B8C35D1|nr:MULTISPECIES: hypothetical protein [unclassified Cohnella]OXS54222.1 hypothetical protein B1A99_26905 [Cohnella sp. CIP 111063]PRX63411.1 hypothetical protein B0G52_12135 [Cohnella sp. SGD-V74]